MNTENLSITIDKKDNLFYTIVSDQKAYIRYREAKPKVLDLRETFVPKTERHKGIASELANYALKYAKSKKYVIIPTCTFIEDFINKNQEYQSLVLKK